MPDNREIVLEALLLHDKGEYADKIIKSILDKYSYLERFERGFINRVFTGTIERRLSLDFIINHYSTVKVNKQKPVIRVILRMSVYQLLFMDSVPDSAVINEAVKLAKKKKFHGLSGFVNGVLRNVSREKDDINIILPCENKFPFPNKEKEPIKYLSVIYSCPEWLCEHFVKECGFDDAERILNCALIEKPITARVNISRVSTEDLLQKLKSNGIDAVACQTKNAFELRHVDGLTSINSFNEGLFCAQDTSSQKIFDSENVHNIIKSAKLIVDVCAAPGGKTCHVADLAEYYGNNECRIISRDISDSKVDKIEDNLDRCEFDRVITEVHDALDLDENLIEKADLVIADLPCSGLGVIGRKVDIKYRVMPEDLVNLANLQKDILRVVSRYVKPGGMMIFSTCTVDRLENADNAEWIKDNLPFEAECEPVQILNNTPMHDGFFISRWIRKDN